MKTSKLHLLAIALLIGLSITSCKKSDNSGNTLTGSEVAVSQDAESQDAQADQVDQSTDNITDALESNNFSATKSATIGGPAITITSSGGKTQSDTSVAAFPKTITLDFTAAGDSTVNGEKFKQSGKIIITVERTKSVGAWKNFIKRTITFQSYTVANDSASFSITGSRVVKRLNFSVYPIITTVDAYLAATKLRASATDSINSNLLFTVTCGQYSKSFTRVVKRTRQAMAHFEKAAQGLFWHQTYRNDTLVFKGSVTGVNLMDSTYTRIIADNAPITFTRCALLVPVISSGTLDVTNGTRSATITYSNDACQTVVTVTNSKGKTRVFDRKLNRLFRKWW